MMRKSIPQRSDEEDNDYGRKYKGKMTPQVPEPRDSLAGKDGGLTSILRDSSYKNVDKVTKTGLVDV